MDKLAKIKQSFEEEGYTLLTKEYINSKQKFKYLCSEGHFGEILIGNWKKGSRCKECYLKNKSRLSYNFVKSEFAKRGYRLLSKDYKSCESKLKVLCPNNHLWIT